MKNLSRLILASIFIITMCTACIVPSRHGGLEVLLPPPLPTIVEVGPDRTYSNHGYNYYYQRDKWQYSRDSGGPRSDLPSSHWPSEVRQRGNWR